MRKPKAYEKNVDSAEQNLIDDPDPDPNTPSVEVRELPPEGLFGKLWAHIKSPFKMIKKKIQDYRMGKQAAKAHPK